MNKKEYNNHVKSIKDTRLNEGILLSSAISASNQILYADGITAELSNTMDLSVRYVTNDEFHKLITEQPELFESKTLYILSSDEINAYNTRIKNIANPIEETDAVNKQYID